MSVIGEMLSYPFLVRALVGGVLVSLCAALLGVSLVLKRYSMIGDGLSHVSFGALSIALSMGWSPLQVSIPVVVIAAFFLLRITENSRLNSDAAIAVISASALAGGLLGFLVYNFNPHDHGCEQLHVRQHPGHEQGGCDSLRDSVGGGAVSVHLLLPQGVRGDL